MTNVLVVEDDKDFRESLCDSLRVRGLNVISASSYGDGLSKLGAYLFHLLLIDASEETAPREDEYRLNISACARKYYPEAVILCITGCGSDNPSLDRTDFNNVVPKPYFVQHTDEILREYGLV